MLLTIAQRYLPGLFAIAEAVMLFKSAPPKRKVQSLVLAAALGLCAMEAEYWIARGFPWSDMPFFVVALAITLVALSAGNVGGLVLGVIGMAFFTYVNDRFSAPYLLDYVLPSIYASLIVVSRRDLHWNGRGILALGVPEATWWSVETLIAVYRTSALHKWAWLAGKPW